MKEIWKDIAGYIGVYQISNFGRVKSLERKIWNGKGYYTKEEMILIPSSDGQGYLVVGLSKNNKKLSKTVHRLVATTHIPNPYNKKQVNHIDGNKENNRYDNLEWCTNRENYEHAIDNGLKCMQKATKASNKKTSKPVYQIDKITDKVIDEFPSIMEAERQTGIPNSHIVRTCKGRLKSCGGFKWQYK